MEKLADALGPSPATTGRLIQFMAAEPGEGVSTIARAFADVMADRCRRGVWLIELDLLSGDQYEAIADDPDRYGDLGQAVRASPDGSCFFDVRPPVKGPSGRPWPVSRLLSAYPVGERRFWVTRFRREALHAGQTAGVVGDAAYWEALRAHAECVIVDAPSLKRSRTGLLTAPAMDLNLLVVSGDRSDSVGPQNLRSAIERAGGFCGGVVLNRAPREPPGFLKALTP